MGYPAASAAGSGSACTMCSALTARVSTTYNRCRSVEGAGSTIDRQALPVTDMINTVDQDCRGEDRERQAGQSDGGHTVADGGFDDAGGDQEEHADRPDGASVLRLKFVRYIG